MEAEIFSKNVDRFLPNCKGLTSNKTVYYSVTAVRISNITFSSWYLVGRAS